MNRLNEALHALAQEAYDNYDILYIQEPWWATSDRAARVCQARSGLEHTAPSTRGRSCTSARVDVLQEVPRLRHRSTLRPRGRRRCDGGRGAPELQKGHRPVVYYNVYNQDEFDGDGRPRGRSTFQRVFIDARVDPVPADGAAVLLGDFNEHHPWWQVMGGTPRRQAREMADWLREHNFALVNEYDVRTFASHATGASSVLDLVFCNPAAGRLDAVWNFRVDAAATGASDHFALLWESPPADGPGPDLKCHRLQVQLEALRRRQVPRRRVHADRRGARTRRLLLHGRAHRRGHAVHPGASREHICKAVVERAAGRGEGGAGQREVHASWPGPGSRSRQ